jgi:hypothetical protein
MAVDQQTVAWVEYEDGGLFRVDTTTAACTATAFRRNPALTYFGMGFVFQPATGVDTLYVAGGRNNPSIPSTLGTISFPSLALTPVGSIVFGDPELTGTGDGQLWGFAPATSSATGEAVLAQIDPLTGATLTKYQFSQLFALPTSYALKFWGGSFWLFLNASIYEVPRATGVPRMVVADSGHRVVGAGVSTCAPLQ